MPVLHNGLLFYILFFLQVLYYNKYNKEVFVCKKNLDDVKKINPKSLYRKAKKMWNNHDPSTKTWGKLMNVKFEKTKTEGATNGR